MDVIHYKVLMTASEIRAVQQQQQQHVANFNIR